MGGTYSDVTTETRDGRWCEMTKRGGVDASRAPSCWAKGGVGMD